MLTLRPAVLLALLPLAACSSSGVEIDPEKQLELYLTTATYLYQDDSLVRAQDQAVKALQLDPENRPMRRMIGWIRLRMGRIEDLVIAQQFFERLCSEDPDDTPALLGLATAQERMGLANDEAARDIAAGRRATQHEDPEQRAAELSIEARRLWALSHANYERVLAGPTQSSKALNGLLRVSALRGDYEESLAWGRQLLEINLAEFEGWAKTLRSSELTETEEKVARASMRTITNMRIEAHLFSATLLHRMGRTGEALHQVAGALELDPGRAELYAQRAQIRSELGEFAAAIEDLDHFLSLSGHPYEHPDVRKAFQLRALCEARMDPAGTDA